jgi:hypothetical protein
MHWLKQHCEAKQVVAVARVTAQPGGYSMGLVDPSKSAGSEPLGNSYASRAAAFTAADALVRSRYSGHTCGASCSGWTEDADAR